MDNDKPVLSLLQQIQSGQIDPRDLSKEVRQQVVEALILEGSSVPQIAQILQVSDKTIRRDVAAIKERNALSPSLDLAKKLIGDLTMKAETHRSYLMRLARSQGASVSERSIAEFYAWKVSKELIEKLQLLGYLPLVPHRISADIYHHENEDALTLGELKNELTAIEGIAKKDGILDQKTKEKIRFLQLKIEKAEIVKDVTELNKKHEENKNEHSNE